MSKSDCHILKPYSEVGSFFKFAAEQLQSLLNPEKRRLGEDPTALAKSIPYDLA